MSKSRRVLIVSYHYLPEVMAASYRIHSWAKYLPKFGWEPIILTRYWNPSLEEKSGENINSTFGEIDEKINCVVYKVPYKQAFNKIWNLRNRLSQKEKPSKKDVFIRKLLNFSMRSFLMVPDEQVGWYSYAVRAALSIIEKHKVEIILSTGGPWTDFKIASKLSRITGVPWAADYRDPWSQRKFWRFGLPKGFMIWFIINRIYERRIAATASALIHVSEPWRIGLSKLLKREVFLIANGFDPELFQGLDTYQPSRKLFTISFIGSLHHLTETSVFLKGFQKFIRDNNISLQECNVIFTGDTIGLRRIESEYDQFSKIKEFFIFNPPVAQREAIKQMHQSHILLSFPLDMEGCCPAKTYEYLASGRPILVSPAGQHRGVVKELLEKSKGGVILDSPEEIAYWLKEKHEQFRLSGYVNSNVVQSAIEEYSRLNQVKKLAYILDRQVR